MMEERIIELESKLAFQEESISELNTVIIDQQNQLDLLRMELGSLNLRLQAVAETSTVADENEPPPPHY